MDAHVEEVIAADQPTENGRLPSYVTVGSAPRIAPNELRVLKAMTGQTLEKLMSDEVDAMQVMVWCALRRAGYNPTWEQVGAVEADMSDVDIDRITGLPVDPSIGSGSTTSLPSATTGE